MNKIRFSKTIIFTAMMAYMLAGCSDSDNNNKIDDNNHIYFVKMDNYEIGSIDEASTIKTMTYKMKNVQGKRVDATALVFYPKTEKPVDGSRIVVWAHGTVGVADACAPSNNSLGENFLVAAKDLLKSGYVVVAPDYEGLGTEGIHPYLHLESEALSAIEAVKAIKEYSPKDFQGDWMVAGQSQGGQAALGVAEYANADTEFKGAVAGAPASNLGLILTQVAPQALTQIEAMEIAGGVALEKRQSIGAYATALSYAALAGVGIKAYDSNFDYTTIFSERAGQIAKLAEGSNGENGECLDGVRDAYIADIIKYMTDNTNAKLMSYGGINEKVFSENAIINDFLDKKSQPGTVKIDKPLLVIQGEADTSVPFVVTKGMVDKLIALGSPNVTFLPVEGASHTQAIVWKNADLQAFIGKYMPAK